ncbi:unnamed protein product [Penicillium glandicola]
MVLVDKKGLVALSTSKNLAVVEYTHSYPLKLSHADSAFYRSSVRAFSPEAYSIMNRKCNLQFVLAPEPDKLGLAVVSILNRGLQDPSSTAASLSGHTYPEELVRFRLGSITGDDSSIIEGRSTERDAILRKRP